ncbi:DUF4344 domain-containing metallopeptidase [Nonomuraea soli]|uniref:Metallopeptidase n=1 Tax=Nonomuraea soli TaxID=1032476 RepID=A0A7W0HTH9_9ACTN|nr:DUF4344 domain-containing metallopeptidase [Nonomuraea soli]MBA2895045.1 hypothetical protein [Nonomuraea soli]
MRLIVLGVLALSLAACGNPPQRAATGASATPSASGQAGGKSVPSPVSTFRFTAGYEAPGNRDLLSAEKLMKDHDLIQQWTDSANTSFVPPVNVPITGMQCDTVNAFYNPDDKSITMCYEMAGYLKQLFAQPEQGEQAPGTDAVDARVVGALNGIFFHELGHGLIDLYDLPTTGKEEDAVDQLSALVLIGAAEESKDYTGIISMMDAWGRMAQAEDGSLGKDVFADEHSLSGQRFYNVMCYLYGSNHNAFLPLVSEGDLPVARAQRCEHEYAKMADSWSRLLQPYLRTDLPSPSPTQLSRPPAAPSPSGN